MEVMRKPLWLGVLSLIFMCAVEAHAASVLPNVDTQPFVVNQDQGGGNSGVIDWGGVQVANDPWSQQNSGSVGHGQQGYGNTQGYGNNQGYGNSQSYGGNQSYGYDNNTLTHGDAIQLNDGTGAIIDWMGGGNGGQQQSGTADGVIDWLGEGGANRQPGDSGGVIDWMGGGNSGQQQSGTADGVIDWLNNGGR